MEHCLRDVFSERRGDRYQVENLIYLFLSGPSYNDGAAERVSLDIKDFGTRIVTVGTSRTPERELRGICSDSSYYIDESYEISCFGGSPGPVDPRPPTGPSSQRPLDLVFVIDASSVNRNPSSESDFFVMIDFIISLIDVIDIGEYSTHVGMVLYSSDARVEFSMGEFYYKRDLIDAIRGVRYIGFESNIYEAFKTLRVSMFTGDIRDGDRHDVDDVVVVLTTGTPNLDRDRETAEIRRAHEYGITLFSIGIGSYVDIDLIRLIASGSKEQFYNYYLPINYKALASQVYEPLLDALFASRVIIETDECKYRVYKIKCS